MTEGTSLDSTIDFSDGASHYPVMPAYRPTWSLDRLTDHEGVEKLHRRIYDRQDFKWHLPEKSPDFDKIVGRFKLPAEQAKQLKAALKRLWLLPFHLYDEARPLVEFYYAELPGIEAEFDKAKNARGRRLCALFRYFTKMLMQGSSLYPQNPVHLAEETMEALKSNNGESAELDTLADLLIDPTTMDCLSGYNAIEAEDPDLLVEHEHERREGIVEHVWKTNVKFDEHKQQLVNNPEFQRDWATIKKHFPVRKYWDKRHIVRRTLIRERGWRKPTHPKLSEMDKRFPVAFDFFCWKWFIYAMRDDEPLVEKFYYAFTPTGTQIFIPGYWSFDAARDVDWRKLLTLHRARGIERQGEKLAANRRARAKQLKALHKANEEARAQGLRGDKRFSYLKQKVGLDPRTDNAQVRRMLREASTWPLWSAE